MFLFKSGESSTLEKKEAALKKKVESLENTIAAITEKKQNLCTQLETIEEQIKQRRVELNLKEVEERIATGTGLSQRTPELRQQGYAFLAKQVTTIFSEPELKSLKKRQKKLKQDKALLKLQKQSEDLKQNIRNQTLKEKETQKKLIPLQKEFLGLKNRSLAHTESMGVGSWYLLYTPQSRSSASTTEQELSLDSSPSSNSQSPQLRKTPDSKEHSPAIADNPPTEDNPIPYLTPK